MRADSYFTGSRGDLLALVAGLVLPLAFAPFAWRPLVWLSMALLFWLWTGASAARAAWRGFLFGLGLFGVGASWVYVSIHRFGGADPLTAGALSALFVTILACYPALAGFAVARLRVRGAMLWVGLMPAVWVLVEWLRSWLFSGFPWLSIGYTQVDSWLAGLAPIGGMFLVSWLVAAGAGLLVWSAHAGSQWWRGMAAFSAMWIIAGLAGHINWTVQETTPLRVALLQGAIPQEIKWDPAQRTPTLELYRDLTRRHYVADLVVWPETAVPVMYEEAREFLAAMAVEARQFDTDLLIGVPSRAVSTGRYHNSLLSLSPQPAFYHKRHLVPFGEYVPFESLLGPIFNILNLPMSRFVSEDNARPLLKITGHTIGVSICYEAAFGEEIIDALPEADLLVNVSNDAWFGDSLAPAQHLEIVAMRAIETGRYILRATNTGISAILDPKGRIMARSPQDEVHVVTGEVYPVSGNTPYAIVRNYLVVLGSLLLIVVAVRHRRRGDGGT